LSKDYDRGGKWALKTGQVKPPKKRGKQGSRQNGWVGRKRKRIQE